MGDQEKDEAPRVNPPQPAHRTAQRYWYETQERAFAPGVGDGWPTVIKAPHTKNARLVRREGDPTAMHDALTAIQSQCVGHCDDFSLRVWQLAQDALRAAEGRQGGDQ